jgi:hypothetical protein
MVLHCVPITFPNMSYVNTGWKDGSRYFHYASSRGCWYRCRENGKPLPFVTYKLPTPDEARRIMREDPLPVVHPSLFTTEVARDVVIANKFFRALETCPGKNLLVAYNHEGFYAISFKKVLFEQTELLSNVPNWLSLAMAQAKTVLEWRTRRTSWERLMDPEPIV